VSFTTIAAQRRAAAGGAPPRLRPGAPHPGRV